MYALNALKRFDAFNVFLNGKIIDTMTYLVSDKMTTEEVRKSLVEHDGYDPNIIVRKER